jgi:hypothetical protein
MACLFFTGCKDDGADRFFVAISLYRPCIPPFNDVANPLNGGNLPLAYAMTK